MAILSTSKASHREPVFSRAWKKSLDLVDPSLSERVCIVDWDEKQLSDYDVVVAYGSDETLQAIRARLSPETKFAGYGHKLSAGIIFEEATDAKGSASLVDRVRQDVEPFRLQGCLSPQILYAENAASTRWRELSLLVDVMPKIKPFSDWSEVLLDLHKFKPYLSCIGYAGDEERREFLEQELRSHAGLRICPLGDMQKPPLSWQNGGINLVNLLN